MDSNIQQLTVMFRRVIVICSVVFALMAVGCGSNSVTQAPVLSITKAHTGNFARGQQNAAYTITVSNGSGAGPTSGTVTVTETVPSGLTLVSMAGTGWTCSGTTCTRSDVLSAGASYPAITATVNVTTSAASPQANQVSISGGGSVTANATDSTTILIPALSITKTHTGNFLQGQQNAIYTVTVSNASGAGPTSGTVTMTETVPAGLTLVAMSGTGWTCAGPTCTRADALAGGASYPAITATVNVAGSATSPQINQVSVSGGASATANASDSTVIPPPSLSVTKTHVGHFTLGQSGATYAITVTNASGSSATSGTVTATETVPTGLTLVSMAGTGWACSGATCTRSDVLAGGASYPAITATVNVGTNAANPQVNQVSVSGGGSATASASDSTVIFANTSNCGTGLNDSFLKGTYAFTTQGFQSTELNSLHPVAIAGSFVADGLGNITGGEEDINTPSGPQHLTIYPGSSYTVFLNNGAYTGCLSLAYFGGTVSATTFQFSLGSVGLNGAAAGVSSTGRIIEYDDTTGTGGGTRDAGILRLQTPSTFVASQLQPRYAFGMDGGDFTGGHFAIAGSFAVNTTGTISNLTYDSDDAGTHVAASGGSGSITGISSTTGRGILTLTGGGFTRTYAVYIVNANEFLAVEIDQFNGTTPITSGRAVVTPGSYTGASLSGKYIIHLSGSNNNVASVTLGLLTITPGTGNSGTLTGTLEQYTSPAAPTSSTLTAGATYAVDPTTGRVTLTGAGSNPPFFYLTTPTDGISAFAVGTDNNAEFGALETQPAVILPPGSYILGSEDPNDSGVQNFAGVLLVPISGAATFNWYQSDGGLSNSGNFTATISTNPDGTGTFGGGSFFITNGTKLFFLFGTADAVIVDVEP